MPILQERLSPTTPRKHAILFVCAETYGVTIPEIMSRSRKEPIAHARQSAMFLMRERLEMSLPAIGRVFGRTHGAVLFATRRVPERLELWEEKKLIQTCRETVSNLLFPTQK